MKRTRFGLPAAVMCAAFLLLGSSTVSAQGDATLIVTVVDNAGGALGAARATVRNASQRIVGEAVLPASGVSVFEGLAAGTYSVLAMKDGYYPVTGEATLEAGQAGELELQLSRYEFADEITVNFLAPRSTSGTKMDFEVRDVPLSISAYTSGFMESLKANRTSDIYDYVTGVSSYGLGNNYDFTIRGIRARDPSSILTDGLPGLSVRWTAPSTINIDKLEVVKGPQSVLYGQLQPGGLINIVTKKPQFERLGKVELLAGSFNGFGNSGQRYEAKLDLTGPFDSNGNWLYRLFAVYEDGEGFRGQPLDSGFHGLEGDSTFIGGAISWNMSNSATLTVDGEYREDTLNWDMGAVAPNNDVGQIPDDSWSYQEPGDTQWDKGISFHLTFNKMFNSGLFWRINGRYTDHDDALKCIESHSLLSDGRTLRRQDRHQINARKYETIDTNFNFSARGLGADHEFLLGAQYNYEYKDFNRVTLNRHSSLEIDIFEPVYGAERPDLKPSTHRQYDYNNYGAYAQDMMSFGAKWKVLLGLRFDNQEVDWIELHSGETRRSETDVFLPMGGVVYQPSDLWSLYGSYSTSFYPASPDRLNDQGEPAFDPEEGVQYELGAKYIDPGGNFDVTLALFDITKTNVTVRVATGVYETIGEESSQGAEIEARFHLFDYRMQLIFGYAYINAEISDDILDYRVGTPLSNVPENSASFWTRYDFSERGSSGFSLGGGIVYESERAGTLANSSGEWLVLPSYWRIDASAHYSWKWLRLNLLVNNLTDEVYYPSALNNVVKIVVGEARTLRLTAGFVF